MKRIILFKLFVLFFAAAGFPQAGFLPGYIINHQKDTIRGRVAYYDNTRLRLQCQFIGEGETVPVNFGPDDLYGFGFTEGGFFVAREVSVVTTVPFRRSVTGEQQLKDSTFVEKVFLELIVEGAANLYKYSQVVFFAEKNGERFQLYSESKETDVRGQSREGQVMVRNVRKYVGVLQFLMRDCPELGSRINSVRVSELPLARLFMDYSECRAIPFKTFKELGSKTQYNFLVKGGMRVTRFSFKPELKESQIFDRGTFGYPTSPHLLGVVSVSNKKLGDNLSFEAGLSWSPYKMSDSTSYTEGVFDHFHQVDVEYHEIGIPLGIHYSFIRPGVTPYLATGILFVFDITRRFDWKWEQVYGDLYTLHDRPDNLIKTMQFGGYINGGLEWPLLNKKTALVTELNFHFTNGIINRRSTGQEPARLQVVSHSNKMNVQFLVGLKF